MTSHIKVAVQEIPLAGLDPDERDLVRICDEGSVTVQAWGDPDDPQRPFSHLRDLRFGAMRFEDHGAACACDAFRVFKFSDTLYTVCIQHGLQEVGLLRRNIVNGNGRHK